MLDTGKTEIQSDSVMAPNDSPPESWPIIIGHCLLACAVLALGAALIEGGVRVFSWLVG